MLEGHGDDLYLFGDRIKSNFSSNIVSNVDHTGLLKHLKSVLTVIGSYPEPYPITLEAVLAESMDCSPQNVVVTNGATDAIYRLAHIYSGKRAAIFAPSFREYQDACRIHGLQINFFQKLNDIPEYTDLIWICNPNNPTGKVWPKEDLLTLAHSRPDILLIVDQAYADYTIKPVISVTECISAGNIVLLSSLTKRFSVPGLRIGYITASAHLCRKVREYGIPWAVNTMAINAAMFLLDHQSDYDIPVHQLHKETLRITDAFSEIGLECNQTDCNFILCRLPEGKRATDLKAFLADRKGILIRDASNFEGLDSRYFRIAAQSQKENDKLIKSIREWMHG